MLSVENTFYPFFNINKNISSTHVSSADDQPAVKVDTS